MDDNERPEIAQGDLGISDLGISAISIVAAIAEAERPGDVDTP